MLAQACLEAGLADAQPRSLRLFGATPRTSRWMSAMVLLVTTSVAFVTNSFLLLLVKHLLLLAWHLLLLSIAH